MSKFRCVQFVYKEACPRETFMSYIVLLVNYPDIQIHFIRITWQISRKLKEQSWLLQKNQKVLKFKYSETSKKNFLHFLPCTLVYRWCICCHVCADSSGACTGALTQMLENESGPIWRPGKTCMCVFLTFIHSGLLVDIVHSHTEAHHQSQIINWGEAEVLDLSP